MSVEDALSFLRNAEDDFALQKQLMRLRGRTALDDLIAIAAERGYRFTVEEYREAIVAVSDGELSEESLKEVRREMGLE
jgi:predicted ribosomally synthesized peptide with nif11-like leader